MEKQLLRILHHVRRQVSRQRLRDLLLHWGCIGAAAGAVVLLLALFLPIYYDRWLAAGLFSAGLLTGILQWWLHRPGLVEVAGLADATGLSEHLSTALERIDKQDLFSELQRKETMALLEQCRVEDEEEEKNPLRTRMKKKVSGRNVAYLVVCLALSALFAILPTRAKLLAQQIHTLSVEQKEQLTEVVEKLEALEKLDPTELAELGELGKLLQEESGLQLPELSESDMTPVEAENLKKQWEEILQEAKRELGKVTTQAELEDVLKRLEKKEQQLAGQTLNNTTASSGNSSTGNGANGTAGSTATGGTNSDENGSASGNSSGSASGEGNVSGNAGTGTDTTGNTGTAEGNSGENGSGQNSGNGTSGTSGSGNSGNGNNGSGTGTGTNGNGGTDSGNSGNGGNGVNGSGQGGGWNQGSSVGMEREHEAVLGEETIILPGETVDSGVLTGIQGENGATHQTSEQALGDGYAGSKVNYGSVLKEYSQQAYSQIEQNVIPSDMQDIVKKYFSGLGQ